MAIPSLTFFSGLLVTLYLLSLVFFAIVRIATGVSIQRLGYLSLRRIAYTLRDGVRLEIRTLGLHLHRPTFAKPTWVSLRVTELKLTIDADLLANRLPKDGPPNRGGSQEHRGNVSSDLASSSISGANLSSRRTWSRLIDLKEGIKRMHGKIDWLRMVDIEIYDSSCVVSGVASFQIASISASVDTRRKTVDRGRLFRHKKTPSKEQRPAEWAFVVKGILFTASGKDSLEILDICSLNVHGFLYKSVAGLRDAAISLKLGRLHIPYEDFLQSYTVMKDKLALPNDGLPSSGPRNLHVGVGHDAVDEPDRQDELKSAILEFRAFVSSILRGIQEIQLAISFIGVSKELKSARSSRNPMFLNFTMNEFGIDLFRLDPREPAHKMYFNSEVPAHQILLAVISIGVSIDDGTGRQARLLYIPMATSTVKTTLPTKTVTDSVGKDAADRNANILFANFVITSPSIDTDLNDMSLILSLLQDYTSRSRGQSNNDRNSRGVFPELLPKANVKISIQEPVIRVVLPIPQSVVSQPEDYDLLISSTSGLTLDIESSHSPAKDISYCLDANLRISAHKFYYQTVNGDIHILLQMETFETRLSLAAALRLSVIVAGYLESCSVHMVKPEVSEGLHQIVQQFSRNITGEEDDSRDRSLRNSFPVQPPPWLERLHLRGSRLEIEVAGLDPVVSQDVRGVALQLQSWSIAYQHPSSDALNSLHIDTEIPPKANFTDEILQKAKSNNNTAKSMSNLDHKALVIQAHGLEAFVVEGIELWEPEPFFSVPRYEITFTTADKLIESAHHVICNVRAIFLRYSLYNYYVSCVAYKVLQRAFGIESNRRPDNHNFRTKDHEDCERSLLRAVTVSVKAQILQFKAILPGEAAVMLQLYSLEGGWNRTSTLFVKSRIARLYAQVLASKAAWARLASLKHLRVDLKKAVGRNLEKPLEPSIEVTTDFLRLATPHQLVLHRILDNLINDFKTVEQLHSRFINEVVHGTGTKAPVSAKQVPKISLHAKCFIFEIEDASFEWKLGLIFRVGLSEQKQRLAREDAFHIKVKNMRENAYQREPSRLRPHSLRTRPSHNKLSDQKSRGDDAHLNETTPALLGEKRGRPLRYDREARSGLTDNAAISSEDAWIQLQKHNASSWKKRISSALENPTALMEDFTTVLRDNDDPPYVEDDTETILSVPKRPGLMTTHIRELHIIIDKPSFPIQKYSSFLHRVGKGMPFDMKYALLIPVSLVVEMGETRVTLRDYPLPLLHVPQVKSDQPLRAPSWSLKTNFVIAEEYGSQNSTRHVEVKVVPAEKMIAPGQSKVEYGVDIHRTVAPVKTYSDLDVTINTTHPTTITWGTSYQPAIQDMMQIIESFTKPQIDPSERVGFWDKIRLVLHSRVKVTWKGGGDVHLRLKGSRDPYAVTGYGAGFVMCFRSDVRWEIHQENDPKKFMTVNCDEYVLAIPDYSSQARHLHNYAGRHMRPVVSPENQHEAVFKKVIVKLTGRVRWLAGLVFERDDEGGKRSFDFIPHYEVAFQTPQSVKHLFGQDYDAFRGFRSQHIHLSIAVVAPVDRDWSVTNSSVSSTYNSMHMSPKFFTHFFDWWSLFSGIMSLPIRQGRLFPGREKSSKKFGRHLATIKYNLLLAPLFISHIYKHKDVEDYVNDVVGATGLKLRLGSFMLDLHQRREDFMSQGMGRLKVTKTSAMRINKAQLDFISADMRAVSASIKGTAVEDLRRATDDDIAAFDSQAFISSDMKQFDIPDEDPVWIDMDDFVELDWLLPAETHPETHIMPLAFAPRFTYLRQTDHDDMTPQGGGWSSRFGEEPTHLCVMTMDNDPQRVQSDLIQKRISVLRGQLEAQIRLIAEHKAEAPLQQVRDAALQRHGEMLQQQRDMIEQKISFMEAMLRRISRHLSAIRSSGGTLPGSTGHDAAESAYDPSDIDDGTHIVQPLDLPNDFNNRFVIHNIQLKWNNPLRNVILRYVHQVSQRRGFVYYMSRRAVKFILDIVEEQQRNKQRTRPTSAQNSNSAQPSPSTSHDTESTSFDIQERIEELLNDGHHFVSANDPNPPRATKHGSEAAKEDLSEEYTAQNSYHVRLIAPQIQLQSEKNSKSVLLVTGREMQLKVIQIMDRSRLADNVSGLVQRRFSVDMDGVQFFVTNQKTIDRYMHLHSANRYGSPKGSSWPPWAPVEVNFDFQLNPFGWFRVVQKTSASLRYDKYNTLRLKYNDEVNKGDNHHMSVSPDTESRIDHVWVEFPHIRAACDSTQYYTMYVIVLDLLLYSEPLEKIRSERLEKIMLAADFSDLSGTPEMVTNLQARVRQLEEIKMHLQVHAKHLNRQGWEDRLAIERDLASCEDELFFIMKAITTSQRKYDDRAPDAPSNGLLRWYLSASEIVWHLMREKNEPLMEIQLQHASYHRTDNTDGSNRNALEIERIQGLNLLPNAAYPNMIAPYFDLSSNGGEHHENVKMFKVHWVMLEAIAGIPVLDQFEVNLFPLRVQLEREVGKKLFEYIFPGNSNADGISPFLLNHTNSTHEGDDSDGSERASSLFATNDTESGSPQTSTRAGSLELRLRPTMTLPSMSSSRPKASSSLSVRQNSNARSSRVSSTVSNGAKPYLSPGSRAVIASARQKSGDSLHMSHGLSSEPSSANLSLASNASERSKKFVLNRVNSNLDKEKMDSPDELTEMMTRASNYMTLAYAKVPSVVLCLSYKGRGERNIEDLHNFVFRMPTLEYRNKTWSNLDLALRLKRDVIKALISHTGAIIGNKFHHHRPSRSRSGRSRERAPTTSSRNKVQDGSVSSEPLKASYQSLGQGQSSVPSDSHPLFIAGWNSQLAQASSQRASLDSMISPRNAAHPNPPLDGHIAATGSTSELVALSVPSADEETADSEAGASKRSLRDSATKAVSDASPFRSRASDKLPPDPSKGIKSSSVLTLGKKFLNSLNQ